MKKTLTTLTLSLLLSSVASTSFSQEMFQDRFGRWHYVDPNERREQAPYVQQERPDLYREFERARRQQEQEYIYNEYRRYRDCSWMARRC